MGSISKGIDCTNAYLWSKSNTNEVNCLTGKKSISQFRISISLYVPHINGNFR